MGGQQSERAIRDQLAASRLLASLPPSALDDLARKVIPRSYRSGEVLYEAGSIGLSASVVVSGRFRARSAAGVVVGEIGRGELVGEVSMLTGEARTATVVAIRDCETLELDRQVFNEVLASHPACYQAVTRQLVERLQRVLTTHHGSHRSTVIALLSDGRSACLDSIRRFIELFGQRAAVVTDPSADVGALESSHEVVLLVPEALDGKVAPWAFGQSDRTLLFFEVEAGLTRQRLVPAGEPFELVLVHPHASACPTGTRRWLDALGPTAHHHIRAGHDDDLGRLERRLLGQENVLVMSGGGARGLAHAGLYRALVERRQPIDAVVGVSSGAVAAACIGMGLDPVTATATATRLFCEDGGAVDLTVPTIALCSGRRMNARLKELCGEHRTIEDLWIPTRFVSANLTTADLHIHDRGLLWRALRASTAIPGVFPPVPEPEGLLVDGGLVANLPIDLVRRLHPGATIIASDVGRRLELLPDAFPHGAEVGGWEAVWSRMRHRRVPGMVRILAQLTALGGAGPNQGRGDLHLDFDLARFGMFDFKKAAAIVEAGYEQSLAALEARMAVLP